MGKKRGSHVDMLFFTLLRRQSMKIKVFLAMTAFISSLVALRSFVQNYNNFFVAAESVHAVGIIALIWKLTTRKTCSGLSLQTQELTALVLAVRICCRFEIGHNIHTFLDIASLVSTAWVIYMMRFKLYVTYNQHLDRTPKICLLIPCGIMAVLVYPNTSLPLYTKMMWAFGVYLEAIMVLPQLHMMQRTQLIEPCTALYVFALGLSRFFGAAYWILRVYESTEAYLFLLGHGYLWVPMVLVAETVQTFILSDFCYYYSKSVLNGNLLVRVPRV
ncbi:putative ER lumen protein retaining receptor [Helianthus annuus]|uniref:ER lumen protein retaining receptor n=1 Tax=Helianthus annuus TaxID=4232 RepID=A0A251SRV1_HELAN|nr:ER lumen protein-retaining receptor erd-2.2 [Helianthus annuus]KAF5782354.1 putative ER lumen protein retaining receptor [Helianthus annuus]KAJ0501851.1 putative ER lumen protein retaining receptor [Helianthus annuus]KAJ0509770.1 putative ER lumen protein retaining receptor [Helianthus annuus]KAJ0517778.1 putative ER lumen protein retaining receptor [Helianthus annuus]KAJ0685795.1 putative ER lumen protein retaining receptor [Helianthus annuus]